MLELCNGLIYLHRWCCLGRILWRNGSSLGRFIRRARRGRCFPDAQPMLPNTLHHWQDIVSAKRYLEPQRYLSIASPPFCTWRNTMKRLEGLTLHNRPQAPVVLSPTKLHFAVWLLIQTLNSDSTPKDTIRKSSHGLSKLVCEHLAFVTMCKQQSFHAGTWTPQVQRRPLCTMYKYLLLSLLLTCTSVNKKPVWHPTFALYILFQLDLLNNNHLQHFHLVSARVSRSHSPFEVARCYFLYHTGSSWPLLSLFGKISQPPLLAQQRFTDLT